MNKNTELELEWVREETAALCDRIDRMFGPDPDESSDFLVSALALTAQALKWTLQAALENDEDAATNAAGTMDVLLAQTLNEKRKRLQGGSK